MDYKRLYADTRELLERARLELDPKMTVRTLNSGQMQLLSLMRAVSKDPKILVLDEPTTALTDQEVDTLMEILASLRERGVSCLYISHKLEELYRICDRALVIRDGQTINSHDIREEGGKPLPQGGARLRRGGAAGGAPERPPPQYPGPEHRR